MLLTVHVLKPVRCRYFSGTEQRMMFLQLRWQMLQVQVQAMQFKEERKDYTDKADPIREHDCIWCMACVSVCPPQAIKVDQSSLEFHEKAAGTFNEALSKGSAPPPHAH